MLHNMMYTRDARALAVAALFMTCTVYSTTAAVEHSYTVPANFPSSVFHSYYYTAEPTRQPQPVVFDPVLNTTYPLSLTDPNTIPANSSDPVAFPRPEKDLTPEEQDKELKRALSKVSKIIDDAGTPFDCSKCTASLEVLQSLARNAPVKTPTALETLCTKYEFAPGSSCHNVFGAHASGASWTAALALANVSGLDGRYLCHALDASFCPPGVVWPPLNLHKLFPKPKPRGAKPPKPSGKRVKVLHISDFHLDPRYSVGAESHNCSSSLCCRANAPPASSSLDKVSFPAPLYGSYLCDTPYFLGTAALRAIHPLTGTENSSSLGWTIYTGDLVSHDIRDQLSRSYVEYAETSVYHMFHQLISGPVFPVLGNHDTCPDGQTSPHKLRGPLGDPLSWNFDHVTALWRKDGWIPRETAEQARMHYGGYSLVNHLGLRIITLNTDFWYTVNVYNFINSSNPDVSGMLHWLIDELQSAEDHLERVWIMGHIASGWQTSQALPNPTNLFYQIVERYSPHVIANIFFGHSHEDEVTIYYSRNGTTRNERDGVQDALMTGWIGPSVTPLNNLNSGFRMYEVDTDTFDVYEAYTYYSDVNTFAKLDVERNGPMFSLEYSTRDAYGPAAQWPADAPLNATFWHRVTLAMEKEADTATGVGSLLPLTEIFNRYQGKTSIKSPKCDTVACAKAKICYMRSASQPLAQQCPQGYTSVQAPFSPVNESASCLLCVQRP